MIIDSSNPIFGTIRLKKLNNIMRFRSYDSLRVFGVVARRLSMTTAANELNQSKGSVSYQINKLESELGFKLFVRKNASIELTEAGQHLWHASQNALDQIDREIEQLRGHNPKSIRIGALTYFLSRWLSPRLSSFFSSYPDISLHIDPLNSADMLHKQNIDIAILWGVGNWEGLQSELLLPCPAVPTASKKVAKKISEIGLEQAIKSIPLLADSSGHTGWRAWHEKAELAYKPIASSLTILDSNSRVQAVIDGQGIALWDDLIAPELTSGQLEVVSDIALSDSGYYLISPSNTFPKRHNYFGTG